MPRRAMAGPYVNFMFTFIRNGKLPEWLCHFALLPAVCQRYSFSAPLLAFGVFSVFNFLTGMQRYLMVFLLWISLMANDVEPPFICLFATHLSSLVTCLFMNFVLFLIEGFNFYYCVYVSITVICQMWWILICCSYVSYLSANTELVNTKPLLLQKGWS